MSQSQKFTAVIEDAGRGGAYVVIPFDAEQVYGKKRIKVNARIDGELYRGSLVRMGGAEHILGIRKDIRERIGKSIGDLVEIELSEDTMPREVTLPSDLELALRASPAALKAFGLLSYSYQKEYIQWVEGAKKIETRQKRIHKAISRLNEGKKNP